MLEGEPLDDAEKQRVDDMVERSLDPSEEPESPTEPVLAEPGKSAMTGYERQVRWRAKNREKYNSYMREYRARKK